MEEETTCYHLSSKSNRSTSSDSCIAAGVAPLGGLLFGDTSSRDCRGHEGKNYMNKDISMGAIGRKQSVLLSLEKGGVGADKDDANCVQ